MKRKTGKGPLWFLHKDAVRLIEGVFCSIIKTLLHIFSD